MSKLSRPALLALGLVLIAPAAAAGQRGVAFEGRAARKLPQCVEGSSDADNDGICDRLERATGTNPYDADTDGDSVPDGEEDANRDGRVDPGESDPRLPGLFPGSAPHIPEPMVFDLVRGLGASRGEIEMNVLVLGTFPRRERAQLEWAPELEWALLDGVAVELEIPMEELEPVAVKMAGQVTLPGGDARFAHGVQAIGERFVRDEEGKERGGRGALLYLLGARSRAWSFFGMLGARRGFGGEEPAFEFLANPSVFYDVGEELTLGVETNFAARMGETSWQALPQLHYQISERFRLQLGGGVSFFGHQLAPVVGSRFVVE